MATSLVDSSGNDCVNLAADLFEVGLDSMVLPCPQFLADYDLDYGLLSF